MIRSAMVIASEMLASNAGDGLPSQCASLRAAKIAAAIRRTCFTGSWLTGAPTDFGVTRVNRPAEGAVNSELLGSALPSLRTFQPGNCSARAVSPTGCGPALSPLPLHAGI
jgi:hypothetical protein